MCVSNFISVGPGMELFCNTNMDVLYAQGWTKECFISSRMNKPGQCAHFYLCGYSF